MDPNLFHIDWERTIEVLAAIIVLAFFVERAGALLFESRWWVHTFEDARVPNAGSAAPQAKQVKATGPANSLGQLPLKELVAFLVSFAICQIWDFDAVSVVVLSDHTHLIGRLVTAAVIAGGSKAAVKLFQDIMGIRSKAQAEREALRSGG